MYGDVVLDVPRERFEHRLEALKASRGVHLDTELDADDWRELVREFLRIVEEETGKPFPQDPQEQLWGAIGAVFRSWKTPRAITYRKMNAIPDELGHRRQRAGDGVRQHGRRLRHRRRLHARSRRPATTSSTASI